MSDPMSDTAYPVFGEDQVTSALERRGDPAAERDATSPSRWRLSTEQIAALLDETAAQDDIDLPEYDADEAEL